MADSIQEQERDERVAQPRALTCCLVYAAITSFAGSSLQFGFNLAVVNAPELIVQNHFKDVKHMTSFLWPFTVSIFAVGGMFGAFIGPHGAQKYGRKLTLIFNNVLVIVGGLLLLSSKYANSVAILIIGRILVGVNAGINTVVAPMYTTEIAPVNLRGSLGTLNQFGIVSGILLANVLGLSQVLGNEKGWPFLFGFTVVIATLQLIALPFCPESPKYLLLVACDEPKAHEALQSLRSSNNVAKEIEEMKLEGAQESAQDSVSILDLLREGVYHKPLLISIVMQLAQQLSGIGGILYYSTSLFVGIGLAEKDSQAATCGVGVLSVVMTAIVVVLVEIKGRKFLMLLGLAGMALFYVLTTIALVYVEKNEDWAKYLAVVCTLAVIVFFQLGPGAIPWFIVAELFTQSSISAAISIAGPTNWLANFAVGLLFPILNRNIKPYTFLPFLVIVILCFAFTHFIVPETKGLTVEEVSKRMKNGVEKESYLHEPGRNDAAETTHLLAGEN